MIIFTNGLLSKWGFNDGSPWESASGAVQDAIFERLTYEQQIALFTDVLKKHVLPKLDQKVEEMAIGMGHNNWRARIIDGRDVHELWCETSRTEDFLSPASIEVPDAVILDMIEATRRRNI